MPQGAVPSAYMQQQMEQDRLREQAKQQQARARAGGRGRVVRFADEDPGNGHGGQEGQE